MRNLVRTLPLVAALLAIGCDSPTEPVRLVVPQLTIEAVGDSRQLEATIFGSDVLPEWESLSPELVSVTRAGMVTALASGEARVRARVGTSVAEGKVTVLPAAVVAITSAERQTSSSGAAEIRLRLQNSGGRGFYRVEYWQQRQSAGGDHQPVLRFGTDTEAPVGMNIISTSSLPGMERVDWLVVYTRNPQDIAYRTTACVRMDGGSPCPIP
jgi:hypothetical protein